MVTSHLKYQLSHLAIRLIVLVNITHLLLSGYHPYFRATTRIFRNLFDLHWMTVTSVILPLYVGFEAWWILRKDRSQVKEVLIDAALAIAWFLIWWGFLLHSFRKYFGSF